MQWPFRSDIVVRADRFRVPKTAGHFPLFFGVCGVAGGCAWLTLMYSKDWTLVNDF